MDGLVEQAECELESARASLSRQRRDSLLSYVWPRHEYELPTPQHFRCFQVVIIIIKH